jgi:hypothetical protein
MSAKDRYHELVKRALVAQGWTITDDPLTLKWGTRKAHIDLGAERIIAAERGIERIAVEVKSFLNLSALTDLYDAYGQFEIYRRLLMRIEPNRRLYLAIPQSAYEDLFSESEVGSLLLEDEESPTALQLVVFSTVTEEIVQWIPDPNTNS